MPPRHPRKASILRGARPVVLLAQLPIPPLSHEPVRGNTPYAAGCLAMVARARGLDAAFDLRILPAREANRLGDRALVSAILAEEPALVGFTTYLWNAERTLWVAARLKERRPDLRVVLGGPEASPDNPWLFGHAAADYRVSGEGEGAFAALLEGLIDGKSPAPTGRIRNLDEVSSPYLAGLLPVEPGDPFLVESARGCVFKCRYCSYPQSYEDTMRVSPGRLAANLRLARERGAGEVFFLDPTLNQRPDFAEFLRLVGRENPEPRIPLHAELRAESITPGEAGLLREAGFVELEIGLQSIDARAQRLMGRRTPLPLFARGIRALRAEGIRAKVDLIVGLPGDTEESVRAGLRWVRDEGLFDEIQVFPLAVLPATEFRRDAARLGIAYDPRPPYLVRSTPDLSGERILALLAEAEEIFGTDFDPVPPPDFAVRDDGDLRRVLRFDLDGEEPAVPPGLAAAVTIRLASRDPFAARKKAARLIRGLLAEEPFASLEVVLETDDLFPFEVFEAIEGAFVRPESAYWERVREHLPGRVPTARRIAVVLPAAVGGADPDWLAAAAAHAEVFFRDGERFVPAAGGGS